MLAFDNGNKRKVVKAKRGEENRSKLTPEVSLVTAEMVTRLEPIIGRRHRILGLEATELLARPARVARRHEQALLAAGREDLVLDAQRQQHERALAALARRVRAEDLDRSLRVVAGTQAFRHWSRYPRYSSTSSRAGGLQVGRPFSS